jgi:hypothetical protein
MRSPPRLRLLYWRIVRSVALRAARVLYIPAMTETRATSAPMGRFPAYQGKERTVRYRAPSRP